MTEYIKLKYYCVLLFGIFGNYHSKIIMNIRVYNYRNDDDVNHRGVKCETLHYFNDYCDPVFTICVSSASRCDILHRTINHWKNKKFIQNLFTQTITLKKMQKSLSVDINIDDHDSTSSYEHIARFYSKFEAIQLNHNYERQMTVTPSRANVQLYMSLSMKCLKNYYGNDCDQMCELKPFNYKCNRSTGSKICILDCGIHGNCSWDNTKQEYFCKCESYWKGDMCQFSNFESCSNFRCKKTCSNGLVYRYCSCINDPTKKICQEMIKITPTTIQSTSGILTTKYNIEKSTTLITHDYSTSSQYSDTTSQDYKNKKNKETTNHQQQLQAVPPPTTIIIICLLLLLCIGVISLSIIIRSWKIKDRKKGLVSKQRPLPPVFYEPNHHSRTMVKPMTYIHSLPDSPETDYDLCTVQSEAPLIKFDGDEYKSETDLYEEPIINKMESLTCETFDGDDDSIQYEEPTKMK